MNEIPGSKRVAVQVHLTCLALLMPLLFCFHPSQLGSWILHLSTAGGCQSQVFLDPKERSKSNVAYAPGLQFLGPRLLHDLTDDLRKWLSAAIYLPPHYCKILFSKYFSSFRDSIPSPRLLWGKPFSLDPSSKS